MGPHPVTGKETKDGSGESCLRESRGLGALVGEDPRVGWEWGGVRGTARDVSLVSCIHVTPSRLPVRYSKVRQGTNHSKNAPAHHIRRPVKNRQCGHRCQAIAGHVAGLTIGP